jgi:O-acetylserine/cysteine efflux transporter
MPTRERLSALLVVVTWGSNFVVIDLGLADVPPLLFLAIRFTLVAFPLVLVLPRPGPWRDVLLVGALTNLGHFGLLYVALGSGMPAGLAPLVLQVQVMFTLVLAAAVLGERSSHQQLAGIAVSTVGLVVVAVSYGLRAPVVPLLITVAAALSWSCGNVVVRRASMGSGLGLVAWSALAVPLPALAASLVLDGPAEVGRAVTHLGWAALASTGFTVVASSLFGYAVWNGLVARYPAGAVMPFILLVPPVGMAAGWMVQGDAPAGAEIVGGAVMLGGVAVASLAPSWSRRRAAVPDAVGAP